MVILELWSRQPGNFFCLATKSPDSKFKEHFFSPDEFGKIKGFLRENQEKDIYFCPHGFKRRIRRKEEAVLPNVLWADLDYADPRDEVHFRGLKPTIAIESSPGRFVGLWETDEVITESLNRRLTYLLEADPGGWDITQLLRVPGTYNHKYSDHPRVRVLWDDGPKHKIAKLEKRLPADEVETPDGELNAVEVFQQYESKLPRWARRELMAKSIKGRTDRSEMLWKLENVCIEVGMSFDEAFAVIKNSAWNKFSGRRGENKQLTRELSKIVENRFKQKPEGKPRFMGAKSGEEDRDEEEQGMFVIRSLKDIEEEKMDWIWYPYLARKTLSILEGDPGLGKSYMAMIVSGSIAKGVALPCRKKNKTPVKGAVVYFDIENNAASVTKVRLKYNGFDKLGNYYPVEQAFSIDDPDAMDEVTEVLERIRPTLVVFDTLNTYIGKADTHKASEATQAMGVFKAIADNFNCAVLVLRHLTKGSGSAMYRGQGSVAFAGSARVVMCVGVDPEDHDTRVMAIVKGNNAPNPGGLSFRIEGRPKGRSEFIWEDFNNLSAQEVMDASTEARAKKQAGSGIQEAMEFLEATLTGPVEEEKLYRMAEKRSVSKKMLDRAASKMGIKKKKKGKGPSKTHFWELKGPRQNRES